MSFLIRSIFWLGLVFMALPWDGESLRADLSSHTQQATRALTREAQALCAKDPIGCATQAITLGKAFEPTSSQDKSSQDTLRAPDLAPAWRGPSAVASRR
jgi:hypothetical protein